MNYKEKQYDEIFENMLNDAFKEKLISYDDEFKNYIANKEDISNFYVMLLAIHSEAITEVYRDMTKVYNSRNVDLAEGIDLDNLGVIINCKRPVATHSIVELLFNAPNVEFTSESEGIIVSSKKGIQYKTVEPLVFSEEQTSCSVAAYAVNAGTSSSVIENQLTTVESATNNKLFVTNPKPSFGGSDAFNDEQYRELLKNWVKTKQRGNEWAYKEYFDKLDGLDDYKLAPNWDGSGTLKVILSPSFPYFLNKVYNELQSEITQATEDIVVTAPLNKSIDIYINCNVDIDRLNPFSSSEKENIKSRIEQEVKKYISSMKIGQDFIPLKLAVTIDKSIDEIKNIEFNYPSKPVTVSDEEKCMLGNFIIDME